MPTPTQIKNRIIFNRWLKRQRKSWLNTPFILLAVFTLLTWCLVGLLFYMGVII